MPRSLQNIIDHAEELAERFEQMEPTNEGGHADAVDGLRHAVVEVAAAERRLASVVSSARAQGLSWTSIGTVVGTTGEAARRRYGTGRSASRMSATMTGDTSSASIQRSRSRAIAVEPRPSGRWAVQKEGTRRASKLFESRTRAVESARQQARREGVALVVKDERGRIVNRVDSAQPRSRVGRR